MQELPLSLREQHGLHEPEWFRTTSPDEANRYCRGHWYAYEMTPTRNPARFHYDVHAISLGPISMMDLFYTSDVQITAHNADAYKLVVPMDGRLDYHHHRNPAVANPERSIVLPPHSAIAVDRWHAGSKVAVITIETMELEVAAAKLFGDDVPRSLASDDSLPVQNSRLQSVARLLHTLNEHPNLVEHPLVATPAVELIVNGILMTITGPDILATTSRPKYSHTPNILRQAMEFIDANASQPLTVADIAASCWISVRALQATFARHLGKSPMTYLRDVRLRQAHQELCKADPRTTSVADVAHRWGYAHLSRFASNYRSAYGESPSETLRSAL